MYVTNFTFWVCGICINHGNGIIMWLESIILQSLEKGVPWKFWLDPRFPRNSKLKQILKWLPLDRGCFKVYFFTKGRKYTNNLVPYVRFPTCNFVVLFQVIIALPCILSLLNTSCLGIIDRQSLEKEVVWKLWLDPRFPCHPK